ncbi:hypothetical protein [Rhabdothermincola salaria]|uniref:hypothetical protein n=1 Tax=Rhabdothermincola salaria TaxID=2903142 RepID=UPI001E4FFAF2|nr:hypothetical protein [Rhabdothermincola salaria]MCD9622442.1 hypothetical protein [Rhabdothermincola salaria]
MSDTGSADHREEPSETPPDPTADETLASLQGAARQLIAAARGLLDAAEVALEDPALVRDAVGTLGGLARDAARLASDAGRSAARGSSGPDRPDDADQGDEGDEGDGGAVQRIPVE